jgi:hypothetical protein
MWLPPPPDVTDPAAVPYFNWDAPVTNATIRSALAGPDVDDRRYWMARILREARYDDVWAYLRPREVHAELPALLPLLGRRRDFWVFLFDRWRAQGVV